MGQQVGPALLEPELNLGRFGPFEYRGQPSAPNIHRGQEQRLQQQAEYIVAIRHVAHHNSFIHCRGRPI